MTELYLHTHLRYFFYDSSRRMATAFAITFLPFFEKILTLD